MGLALGPERLRRLGRLGRVEAPLPEGTLCGLYCFQYLVVEGIKSLIGQVECQLGVGLLDGKKEWRCAGNVGSGRCGSWRNSQAKSRVANEDELSLPLLRSGPASSQSAQAATSDTVALTAFLVRASSTERKIRGLRPYPCTIDGFRTAQVSRRRHARGIELPSVFVEHNGIDCT